MDNSQIINRQKIGVAEPEEGLLAFSYEHYGQGF